MTRAGRRATLRSVLMAAGLATVGAFPVFLLGAVAVLVRADLGFGEERLGVTVATFFACAALGSGPAGRIADRLPPRVSLLLGVSGAGVALAGAAAAQHWWQLTVALGLGGAAHALTQVATNLLVSIGVASGRQGLGFGVKQAAIPFASMLAGVAVPLLGVTIGWRSVFAVAAAIALLAGLVQARSGRASPTAARRAVSGRLGTRRAHLLVLAVGLALVAGCANSMASFYVEYAVSTGVPVGRAGSFLAVAGVVGMTARISFGWLADRWGGAHLWMVAALAAVGSVAYLLLPAGAASAVVLVLAGALVYGAGWGWPGLLNSAVVRVNPDAPASATGLAHIGVFVGAVVGPLVMGVVVARLSYDVAWIGAGVATLLGAGLVAVAHRLMAGRAASAS